MRLKPSRPYLEFLKSKHVVVPKRGFKTTCPFNPKLFDYQRHVVAWALELGRAAIFADTGLGKTPMQLEWSHHVALHTGKPVLILTPLAVAAQTKREGAKFGYGVTVCRTQADVRDGINVTNYEMLKEFDPSKFGGVVLDESSVLKSYMGKQKQAIIRAFRDTEYKLACTATPAPNDHVELGNHADFLGIIDPSLMLSIWFLNDTMQAGNYRLKTHAEKSFWDWVSSWACCFTNPDDIGFDGSKHVLPPLEIINEVVEVDITTDADDGWLIRMPKMSATNIHEELRFTAAQRAARVAELIAADTSGSPWVVWCHTDYEAEELVPRIPGSVEVHGSETPRNKEAKLAAFAEGKYRVIISKPKLCGFGLNWQHAHNVAFVGLSYSYEELYQAIRRCYRFGQTETVRVHIVTAETEGPILSAITRKEAEHIEMKKQMIGAMKTGKAFGNGGQVELAPVEEGRRSGKFWDLRLGDNCQAMKEIPDGTIDLTVTSPPFETLYIYSESEADMGNSKDSVEFFEHFSYAVAELHRITRPGRLAAIHCKDLPAYKGRDGSAGLIDFPGRLIACFEANGWSFHSRVTIWKDPVIEMQRTKNHGLLHKELCKDSCSSRQGMADFVLVFRKWQGIENKVPVAREKHARFDDYIGSSMLAPDKPWAKTQEEKERQYSIEVWRRYASPVWFDIDQTDVLNFKAGKGTDDERHICPLQLGVIQRCIDLWSNPGDLVCDLFSGIGSTGYEAVKAGRRYLGFELKPSYFNTSIKNLTKAERSLDQTDMFADVDLDEKKDDESDAPESTETRSNVAPMDESCLDFADETVLCPEDTSYLNDV